MLGSAAMGWEAPGSAAKAMEVAAGWEATARVEAAGSAATDWAAAASEEAGLEAADRGVGGWGAMMLGVAATDSGRAEEQGDPARAAGGTAWVAEGLEEGVQAAAAAGVAEGWEEGVTAAAVTRSAPVSPVGVCEAWGGAWGGPQREALRAACDGVWRGALRAACGGVWHGAWDAVVGGGHGSALRSTQLVSQAMPLLLLISRHTVPQC